MRQHSLKKLYELTGVWKSKTECIAHLKTQILHKDDSSGLLVLNKPYNVGVVSVNNGFSFEDLLPELKEALRLPHLEHIISPERFSSGLSLFGMNPKTSERVLKARRRTNAMGILSDKYLVVTDGFPRMDGGLETLDSSKHKLSGVNDLGASNCEPVLTRKLMSNKKLKSLNAKRLHVHFQVESRSSLGKSSLISLCPSGVRNHFIQLYMADLLSPVIGDFLYSYRVKRVMGTTTKVSHMASPLQKIQSFSPGMLENLGMKPQESHVIPKHIHKFRTVLKGFVGKDKDLILYADPPDFFCKTCESLNLSLKNIYENDKQLQEYFEKDRNVTGTFDLEAHGE